MLLNQYISLLTVWNKQLLLIGKTMTIEKMKAQADLLLEVAKKEMDISSAYILDIGTGAGLPGMFWAMDNVQNIIMIEQSSKRVSFLKHCIFRMKLNASVVLSDIKKYNTLPQTDNLLITAHAFSDLITLFDATKHLWAKHTSFILLKANDIDDEIAQAQKMYTFILKITKCQYGQILFITNISKN